MSLLTPVDTPERAPSGAVARQSSGRPRWRPVAAAVVVVLLAELAVRGVAHRLPVPQRWSSPEAQLKVDQMESLRKRGQTRGVVVLGTSLTDVGVDPSVLAAGLGGQVPVYDASLSGGTVETERWWFDHVVVPLLHPRVVVFGITSRELNPADPEAAGLQRQFFAAPAVRQLEGRESLMQRLDRYAGDVSYLFRYRRVIRRPTEVLHHNTAIDQQRRFLTSLGLATPFAAMTYQPSATLNTYFRTTVTAHFQVGPAKVAALDGLLADVARSRARAVLVSMPVTADYIALHPGGSADFAAFERAMARAAARAGVPELPAQVWPANLFADPIHLNRAGALRLTPVIAGQLGPLLGGGHG